MRGQIEEIKKMLMEMIQDGYEGVKVYDTREILGQPAAHNPGPFMKQKDDFKAKVIYTCEDSEHQAARDYVNGIIENINSIYNLKHPIQYIIKDFYGVNAASVTGKDAFTSYFRKGKDVREDIKEARAFLADHPENKDLLDAAEEALDINATYKVRRRTGIIYRCNFFSEKENRSLQANVGNVLILSGKVHNTEITRGLERKHRVSCYTLKEPDFTLGEYFYYKR